MSRIDSLPPLREVIAAHGLRATKALGQNFLLDLNLTDKIARSAGDLSGCVVIEIGPGPGGLTRALLKTEAREVIALEFDPRAVAALQGLIMVSEGRLHVLQQDALAAGILTLTERRPIAVVANLPYNIATPLLIGWLRAMRTCPEAFRSFTLMFQKEVAERITTQPDAKAYGRLAVMTQWLCDVKKLFDIPAVAFTPPPKVVSSVVRMLPKELPAGAPSFEAMETITRAAFAQRRKMIRQSLKEYLPLLEKAGIDPTLRAENLSCANFISLAQQI